MAKSDKRLFEAARDSILLTSAAGWPTDRRYIKPVVRQARDQQGANFEQEQKKFLLK